MKRIRPLFIFLFVVMFAAVGSVSALCIPAKTFTNYNTIEVAGAYYYILWGDPSTTSDDIDARFWETNNRAGSNEGSYDDALWLPESIYYPGQDLWYLNGVLSSAGVFGCPKEGLTVVGTNSKTGTFFAASIDETPGRSVDFDFSRMLMDFPTAPMASPRLVASSRTGTDINLTVQVDDASAGVFGGADAAITDVVIYSAVSPGSTEIAAGGWIEIGRIGSAAGQTSVVVDCSAEPPIQQSVGAGMQIGGVDPTHVSPQQSLVECDGNLADPGRGKLVPADPGKPGRGTPKRR
jgi:hypothetical protein